MSTLKKNLKFIVRIEVLKTKPNLGQFVKRKDDDKHLERSEKKLRYDKRELKERTSHY